jgi:hypothetical protein
MSVRCDGDSRAMEQLGERQDFEAELSRLGFPHEVFELYIRHSSASGATNAWTMTYTVFVTNTATKRRNLYWGGPGKNWVSKFSADASSGYYGPPEMSRPTHESKPAAVRPWLVIAGGRST